MAKSPSMIRPPANYSITLTPTSAAISPIAAESESPQDDLLSPRPKRRKVRLACRVCRRRKTRCDGTLPVCQACTSRGVEDTCVYVNIADDSSNQSMSLACVILPPSDLFLKWSLRQRRNDWIARSNEAVQDSLSKI